MRLARGPTDPASLPEFNIDVDSDGIEDARFRFLTGDTSFTCTDTEAMVEGKTASGRLFSGFGEVTPVCDAVCH
jgi:hypothetical protein